MSYAGGTGSIQRAYHFARQVQCPAHGVTDHARHPAIVLIGIPSDRCNRRISAQSSTDVTPSASTEVVPSLPDAQAFSRIADIRVADYSRYLSGGLLASRPRPHP